MDWKEWDMEDEEELQFYLELSCEEDEEGAGLLEEGAGLLKLEAGGRPWLARDLLVVPEPERMSHVLDETLGPLPILAPVRKFKRQPAGHYDASTDVQDLFGKRRAANARERHRVQSINGGFSKLRSIVPLIRKDRKPSKVHVLRAASEYIRLLHNILQEPVAAEEMVKGAQAAEPPNFGELSLPVNRRPTEEIHDCRPHLPVDDAAGGQLGFPADEEEPNVWPGHAVPCVGIVQLEDGNLVTYPRNATLICRIAV